MGGATPADCGMPPAAGSHGGARGAIAAKPGAARAFCDRMAADELSRLLEASLPRARAAGGAACGAGIRSQWGPPQPAAALVAEEVGSAASGAAVLPSDAWRDPLWLPRLAAGNEERLRRRCGLAAPSSSASLTSLLASPSSWLPPCDVPGRTTTRRRRP